MQWIISSDRPVYLQLVEQLELAVVAGAYPLGSKVPSVRDLAAEAAVNPNTMQRALQTLEARGLVTTQRTAGRTITEDGSMIDILKKELAQTRATEFLRNMQQLGFTVEDVLRLLQETARQNKQETQEEA